MKINLIKKESFEIYKTIHKITLLTNIRMKMFKEKKFSSLHYNIWNIIWNSTLKEKFNKVDNKIYEGILK